MTRNKFINQLAAACAERDIKFNYWGGKIRTEDNLCPMQVLVPFSPKYVPYLSAKLQFLIRDADIVARVADGRHRTWPGKPSKVEIDMENDLLVATRLKSGKYSWEN